MELISKLVFLRYMAAGRRRSRRLNSKLILINYQREFKFTVDTWTRGDMPFGVAGFYGTRQFVHNNNNGCTYSGHARGAVGVRHKGVYRS